MSMLSRVSGIGAPRWLAVASVWLSCLTLPSADLKLERIRLDPATAAIAASDLQATGVRVLLVLADSELVVQGLGRGAAATRNVVTRQPWTAECALSPALVAAVATDSPGPTGMVVALAGDPAVAVARLTAAGAVVQWIEYEPIAQVGLLVPDAVFEQVRSVAGGLLGLLWADLEGGARLLNWASSWRCQSGRFDLRTVYDHGLHGDDQVIAVIDTGIDADSCFFTDAAVPVPALNDDVSTTIDPAHRKILAVDFLWDHDWPSPGPADWDNHGHGTHVAGTLAGDGSCDQQHQDDDGMASAAKLIIQDGGFDADSCADLPGLGCPVRPLEPLLEQAYDQGARIHSNSWGDEEEIAPYNRYTERAADVDRFVWEHPDLLVVFAAGNAGPDDDSVISPSTAKNALSVGAADHGDDEQYCLASFSSRGWTHDGRIKPEVIAPGSLIRSASNDSDVTTHNCDTSIMSGTSTAAPTVAGLAALVRQYFIDGYYPSGEPDPRFAFEPSAALLKAMLIASARDLSDECAIEPVPSRDQGWGSVQLDRVLTFAGSEHTLLVLDRSDVFSSPSDPVVQIDVELIREGPLKVVLAWPDPPSTSLAATNLINDLDLTVSGPGGTFLGNQFAAGSSIEGGAPDRLNTVEVVLVPSATPGSWMVTLAPHAIVVGPQSFALVVVAPSPGCTPAAEPQAVTAVATDTGSVVVDWQEAGDGPFEVWRRHWGCTSPLAWAHVAGPLAAPPVVDDGVEPGVAVAYTVTRPDRASWCGAAVSACVQATPAGLCARAPQFAGIGQVESTLASDCGLAVSWPEIAGSCTGDVVFNVYRGTGAALPEDLIAAGLSGSLNGWTDSRVHAGMRYEYLVRAEDRGVPGPGPAGGREDGNTTTSSAEPTGEKAVLLADGGGDGPAELAADPPWRFDPDIAFSGTSSWYGCDIWNLCSALTSGPLDLAGGERLHLTTRWNLAPEYDGGVVELRALGATDWTVLQLSPAAPGQLRWENGCGYPNPTPAFSGESEYGWQHYSADLSFWQGQRVELRLSCSTADDVWRGGTRVSHGWWVDDVLVSRYEPCSYPADADCNGEVTESDLHQIAAVLFGGSPCGREDVNGDGHVDAADLADVAIAITS